MKIKNRRDLRPVVIYKLVKDSRTNKIRKEESKRGYFHSWGVNYTEYDAGPANFSVAIVEYEDGLIGVADVSLIQFLDVEKSSHAGNLRPVEVIDYEKNKRRKALFHTWGTEPRSYGDKGEKLLNVTVAIVENDNGSIEGVFFDCVKFLDVG